MRFTPFVGKREAGAGVQRTAAERNVRIIEQIFPQDSPDPIRRTSIPCRPSRRQIVTFFHDTQANSDARFQSINPEYYAGASAVPGRNAAWDNRVNTAPPQHVAYGSLFTADAGGY